MDRFTNIRQDPVTKFGLKHRKSRISAMVDRQIHVTKVVEMPPVSMLKDEDYVRKDYRGPFKVWDPAKSMAQRDLDCNVGMKARHESPISRKVFIKPLKETERVGPKWGQAA